MIAYRIENLQTSPLNTLNKFLTHTENNDNRNVLFVSKIVEINSKKKNNNERLKTGMKGTDVN